ncbi:MAG TPA: cation-transporting P-type ATPase [Candidatus Methylomirabilis sp.]|nr:cation-transporting P-type ATPase [Candidatus Methylomirabilis sp.]
MKIHRLTANEALANLHTRAQGLSAEEARRRLQEFGSNRIERVRTEHGWRRLWYSFTHFLALILWLAAGLAFFADYREPGQGMGILGAAILGVILINGIFSFWQEHRVEQALAALQRLLPHQVKVTRDNALVTLPAAEIVPGDIVWLEAGDDIPADCRVLEAFGARVDNATITGESVPLPCDARPSAVEELLHARNILLAGTSLVAGEIRAVVFATGMRTEFGKIAHLTQTTGAVLSPLQREIVRLTRVIAAIATVLGILFYFIGYSLVGLSFWASLIFAIGIIVANVPEGLLPTVTLALAMGGQRMVKRNVLIRHLPSVETLGCATVICTDKTGTLTQNRMEIRQLFIGGALHAPAEAPKLAPTCAPFFEIALHCHNLRDATTANGPADLLGDPMEAALARLAQTATRQAVVFAHMDEIPFDSERRRLSTVHDTAAGQTIYTKGALEAVLPLCRQAQPGAVPEPLTPELAQTFVLAEASMAEQGLRVLALAYRPLPPGTSHEHLEEHLILVGLVGFRDPPRPEVPDAVLQCREAGIKVIMVTGDHPRTALAIAREIGLVRTPDPTLIAGEQLRKLSEAELLLALDAPEIVFARVAADQKLRIVRALKQQGATVAATGDGVNDAPALKQADIGIAMGVTGTDVARESAHMVLLDDNFASIVAAIEEGRAVYDNMRKFLTYILTHNVAELVPYLAFALFRIPLPLTVIQILAVDLGTDVLPALALGAELPEPEVMRRPPRSPKERLLNWPVLARAYLWLGLLEAAAAMAAFFFVLHDAGWNYGETLAATDPVYLQASTACLSAIIVMQVVNVFLCRSENRSTFDRGSFRNRLILGGIAVEIALILLIDYTPWGNRLIGTAPISLNVWLSVVPFALAMLALEELRKALARRL